ncbi:MAG TPA: AraC family transcriptional regulator [Thermomonospora sp.]|nr:AraC family transcriptional regulator [Thermomonospora sp.]
MNDTATPADQAVWTRVEWVQGGPLDLMTARMARTHFAPHSHEEYAIGACFAGLEVIRCRGGLYYSGPDSVVVIEPGESHTGGPAIAEGMAYRVAYPATSLLVDATSVAPHFPEPVFRDPELAERLRRAHVALTRGTDPLEGEARLLSALADLVARHARPAPSAPGGADAGADDLVARVVMERFADELVAPPSLAEIAGDLGMSRYRLIRTFRATVGMPPYAWLAQHRVHRARALLERGHRPAEAAALTGFADQAHLTRWFRRVLAVTPGAFRNSVQDPVRRAG